MGQTTSADGAAVPPTGDAVDWILVQKARAVRSRAYAPYSGYHVGAALRGGDGRVYVGCNVENSSYPEGQCAEAGAISAMVADGCTSIAAVAIVGTGDAPCAPCGGCRQKIAEFAPGSCLVHMADESGTSVTSCRMETMLPAGFTLPSRKTTTPSGTSDHPAG